MKNPLEALEDRCSWSNVTQLSSQLIAPGKEFSPELEGAEEVWVIHNEPSEIIFPGSGINT